ncbi:transcriptional regulator [Kitasatospora herbaricolor]|uniref:helix-turn-helix domain-containing protein n=1 Tax=Kitasatospora herbaricolor TaxID=68217 RepID=UPI00174CAC80|nr:XRE family transcriptional regulator [Kitasatospora herbaricolor]MDQ0312086.1 transcriptional regulator with XRE-family HTH domain [Kitasatospora herbaricolor]GGU98190.1 transcriptional regulator [Kitasatospora herbaricolor]
MPDPDLVTQALARNLKRLRTERGYTLDALAARAGVSRGMIVQIEQARTNPSVASVVRLADALGASIARLLDYDESAAVRIVTADQAVPLWSGPAGGSGTLLSGVEAPGPLELWAWRLEPGEGYSSEAHPAGTVEIVRVETGELTLSHGDRDHAVPAGSTASFEASESHGYRNDGAVPVRLTMVVSVPPPR